MLTVAKPPKADFVRRTVCEDVDCTVFIQRAARSLDCTDDAVIVEEINARANAKVHAALGNSLEEVMTNFATEHASRLLQIDFDVKPIKIYSVRELDEAGASSHKYFALQAVVVAYKDIGSRHPDFMNATGIYYKTFGAAARISIKRSA